ncbi:hypothetical protein MSVAZ_2817 [Methanosarcina vacuolata Z-761]|uniref:Uncharacterized protein n=2 Tax=Methanosarcina vacuolata TaxID=2215 RepID=A0A0E3LHY6_9EURY|nr:hypothetical protein MSVAZ_2817 [Methanosarcina vacuolata Z-761]
MTDVMLNSAISMITTPGIPMYSSLILIALTALLSLKDILSASKIWNKHLNNSFNNAIVPLLFSFIAIIVFKVAAII